METNSLHRHVFIYVSVVTAELIRLEFQLDTFIDDMPKDDRVKCVNHLVLCLLKQKKHVVHDLVYMLLKLILLLPVATVSVERVFPPSRQLLCFAATQKCDLCRCADDAVVLHQRV
jgi:hypothetical protein